MPTTATAAIALDTGHLYESLDGVTGHPQMVLQGNFRCVLDLSRRTVTDGTQTGASHRSGRADRGHG